MSEINGYRKEINEIDEQMAKLFEKRMLCAGQIADYKKKNGLPVFDEEREKELLEKNKMYVSDVDIRAYYEDFLKENMKVSKRYQRVKIAGRRVAYSGIEGSFASIAARRILPDAERVPCMNFKEAYEAVVHGECEAALLPIENSFAGEVGQVSDLMFAGDLVINGIYELTVSQCLLGVPGSTIDSVKTVYSHPQALEQSKEFLDKHDIKSVQFENTARAAKEVADKNDITIGAVASYETSELYGLSIIKENINSSANNITRFAVFTKKYSDVLDEDGASNFVMMFTVSNEAGTLARAISILGKYGYSMRVIRSRPTRDENWTYYFYTEVEGRVSSESGKKMMEELSKECSSIKILGTFEPGIKV